MLEELITTARRVYCLYRVSTLGQVEKDDIPMQKEACREFVQQHPGWEIVKEFSEKGVSGFKVSAKDRDAIQEIQRDALQNKFDILLVLCLIVWDAERTKHRSLWNGSPKTVLKSGASRKANSGLIPMLTSC